MRKYIPGVVGITGVASACTLLNTGAHQEENVYKIELYIKAYHVIYKVNFIIPFTS